MWNRWEYIDAWDFILIPFYLFIFFLIAYFIQKKNIEQYPYYKYFLSGLFIKFLGGLVFALIYLFYYPGGDTLTYYEGAKAVTRLLYSNPLNGIEVIFGTLSADKLSYFNEWTGSPGYYWGDFNAFSVCRLMIPFMIFGLNKYIITTLLLDFIAFIGFWKFYVMLNQIYPTLQKQLAIAILFIPSVVFWGSGIMKDTFTMMAALWFTYNVYSIFIVRQKIIQNIFVLLLNICILLMVKPYVLTALLPATLVWASYAKLKKIKSNFIRSIFTPLVIIFGLVLGFIIISLFGKSLGNYSNAESIFTKAKITQQDLIRSEQYGSNNFNIGEFDLSIASIASKAPIAIISGLFRPFIWEIKNIVMLFSGIENLIFLIFFAYITWRLKLFNFIGFVRNDPYLMFAFIFSITFAFSVGLSTANFGALVRYKIPAIPFLVSSLFILWEQVKIKKKNNLIP